MLGATARGRGGLATVATLLTVDYGFHVSVLRMIWLKVLERNVAGIRAYTRELIMDAVKENFPDPSAIRGMTTED